MLPRELAARKYYASQTNTFAGWGDTNNADASFSLDINSLEHLDYSR